VDATEPIDQRLEAAAEARRDGRPPLHDVGDIGAQGLDQQQQDDEVEAEDQPGVSRDEGRH
jgi:hypothetical protein